MELFQNVCLKKCMKASYKKQYLKYLTANTAIKNAVHGVIDLIVVANTVGKQDVTTVINSIQN